MFIKAGIKLLAILVIHPVIVVVLTLQIPRTDPIKPYRFFGKWYGFMGTYCSPRATKKGGII